MYIKQTVKTAYIHGTDTGYNSYRLQNSLGLLKTENVTLATLLDYYNYYRLILSQIGP